MAYCEIDDLAIGDMLPLDQGEQQGFIDRAAREINSKVGQRYVMPSDPTTISQADRDFLWSINWKMATGRLIMAKAAPAEGTAPNAYALFLLREANNDLMAIVNGAVSLDLPAPDDDNDPTNDDPLRRVPGSRNPDLTSAVTAFELSVMNDRFWPDSPAIYRPHDAVQPEHLTETVRLGDSPEVSGEPRG